GNATVREAVVWVDRAGKVLGRAIDELLEDPRDPALSPDGTRLALTTGPIQQGDIWSYDLRGRPPIRLAVVDDDRHAVWSPDSKQVAFNVISSATNVNVYTVLADGSMLTSRRIIRRWTRRSRLMAAGSRMPPLGRAASRFGSKAIPRASPCASRAMAATSRTGPPTAASSTTCEGTP